jgi:hypothetical protein
LGRTQCFRANVAYSLYGVKAGKTAPSNPCQEKQYINSFFTTGGIESFGDSVGVGYGDYGASTTCTATYTGSNRNLESDHNTLYYPDYTSTTLGCSAGGKFIAATFQGAYCDGNHFISNDGEIEDLNEELDAFSCFQIYGNANNGDDGDAEDGAESLLAYSSSCSHTEYPNRCPDPHGIKQSRDQKLYKYAQSHYRAVPLIMPIMSTLLLVGAAVLYCMANGIRDSAKRRALESTTGEAGDPTIYEQFSNGMNRVGTDISQKTRTFAEKLAEYAEEEDGEGEIEQEGTYQAPESDAVSAAPSVHTVLSASPSVHSEKQASLAPSTKSEVMDIDTAVSQGEIANAMLAEKGVTPISGKPTPIEYVHSPSDMPYKRPRMAKMSKWIRGRFGRRKNKTVTAF